MDPLQGCFKPLKPLSTAPPAVRPVLTPQNTVITSPRHFEKVQKQLSKEDGPSHLLTFGLESNDKTAPLMFFAASAWFGNGVGSCWATRLGRPLAAEVLSHSKLPPRRVLAVLAITGEARKRFSPSTVASLNTR